MNLYIYNYNNYYNRIVKKEDTLAAYGPALYTLAGCKDFNPNDGVNTTHVFGSMGHSYNGYGDYLIVADQDRNILSRWFIIETQFTRMGQWNLTLRRDLVVDFYDDIVNAPCFIEKATLSDKDNLIFNSENMSVNEILTETTELKDRSGVAWLVGYMAKDAEELSGSFTSSEDINDYSVIQGGIENWNYYQYANTGTPYLGNIQTGDYIIKFTLGEGADRHVREIRTNAFSYSTSVKRSSPPIPSYSFNESIMGSSGVGSERFISAVRDAYSESYPNYVNLLNEVVSSYNDLHNIQEQEELLEFNHKILKDPNTGKFYRATVAATAPTEKILNITADYPRVYNPLSTIVNRIDTEDYTRWIKGGPDNNCFVGEFTVNTFNVSLEEIVFPGTISYSIPTNKRTTINAPYDIFAIPYGEITVNNDNGTELVQTGSKQLALEIAMAMQVQQAGVIYDIQLLPYFPLQNLITAEGEISVTPNQSTRSAAYSLITKGESDPVSIVFYVPNAEFSLDLFYSIERGQSSIERKINNECKKYRLCSPNYSNYFDFSAEKNGGVQYFNADVSLKPYTPYIHINPSFGGLYGYDNNSPRGLVCGGDYSISQVIDQWQQYQLQNKNYQLTFDRQIQNMEVQNDVQKQQELWGMIAGVGQGAGAGAMMGSFAGAGVAGAVVGGALSLAGGLADISANEKLRNEALDYTKDMFGYQLGNIQALPQTISKISAFNANNKIFPVLEYYTCSREERKAFINKLAYNGMTVMAIGAISDYIGNFWEWGGIVSQGYIKGKLIRLEGLMDEYHLLKNIADEIYKGVYF